jgi:hypothetical protein
LRVAWRRRPSRRRSRFETRRDRLAHVRAARVTALRSARTMRALTLAHWP